MSRRVIVVGGGIAGVTAASRLLKSGKFQVTLLEAMSRIGGRIHTEEIEVNGEKDYLEKGAQWAHGESDTTALVMPFGEQYLMNDPIYPLEENWAPKIQKCTNEGVDITDEATLEKFGQMTKTLLEGPEQEDLAENPSISVGEWFLKAIKADELQDDKAALAWVDFLHRLQIDFDAADSWFETSLRGQLEYQHKSGCTHICWRKGYRSLLNAVINGNPDDYTIPDWIHLNTPVENIDYSSTPIRVTTAEGKVYEADDVISTVSLGVLKGTHENLFSPQLPKAKVETIENLGFGVVDKIHLQFDTQWWEDGWLGLHTLWVNEEAAQQQFPQWCRSILGFYTYGCPSNVLTAWIHGAEARQAEQMDINEVKQVLVKMIKTFLNRDSVPDFQISMSRWFTNPYTRGSYSFRMPNSEEVGVWAKEFTVPVVTPGGMLCFAGEATHPNFYSTVHGAYESANREADRLTGALKD